MTVCISIKPNDTIFFRDARTFTAGVDNIAVSNLPSPITVFGIIGNYYLDSHNHTLEDLKNGSVAKLGEYDQTLKIDGHQMRGPFLAFNDRPYFPAPANIFRHHFNYYYSLPMEIPGEESDITAQGLMHLSLNSPEKIPLEAEQLDQYLSIENIKAFLIGNTLEYYHFRPEQGNQGFYDYEFRTGHQINPDSHTVTESMLYFPRHIRLRDHINRGLEEASFIVDINYLDAEDFSQTAYNIGGERRLARFQTINDCFSEIEDIPEVKEKIKDTGRFFIYLATPAIFEKGWRPKNWPELIAKAKFVAAAVNKPQYISGWQREGSGMSGTARPMELAAPAGSVYFFDASEYRTKKDYEKCINDLYEKYNLNHSISDKYPSAGFGIGLVGTWDSTTKETTV